GFHVTGVQTCALPIFLAASSLAPLLAAAPLVSALLFGVSFLGVITALTTMFRERLPAGEWARAMGLSTAAFATGQALGPTLSGMAGDMFGGVSAALWMASGLLAAGMALAFVPLGGPGPDATQTS